MNDGLGKGFFFLTGNSPLFIIHHSSSKSNCFQVEPQSLIQSKNQIHVLYRLP